MLSDKIQQCCELIDQSKSIAVLTGAGISTSAGIPDFRGPQGLYVTKKYDADKIFDIGCFYEDPEPFYEFARDFISLEETVKPTATHVFLSCLEKVGKLKGIVTQNIDGLHHKAGSRHVFEMHGSFRQGYCIECGAPFGYEELKIRIKKNFVPRCHCDSVIKPDIVFFGENVKYYSEAVQLAEQSDLFMIIGSSCTVNPAGMLPLLAPGRIVIINKTKIFLNVYNVALEIQSESDEILLQVSKALNLGV